MKINEYVLKNVTILDGTKNMKGYISSILIKNNKIEQISTSISGNYKTYDLTGKYIIPGLINLHVHLPGSGKVSKKKKDPKKLVKLITSSKLLSPIGVMVEKKAARMELNSGVTTIRSVGGISTFDTDLKNKINSGKVIGPRILASNFALAPVNGHMLGTVAKLVETKEEAVFYVEELANANSDLIKLMITGGVTDATKLGEAGLLRMDASIVKAACDKAHELGLKVSAHTQSYEGIKLALENGVDYIEHGANLDSKLIDLFKERNASLICTMSPAIIESLLPIEKTGMTSIQCYNSNYVTEKIIDGVKLAIKEDINLGLGNDVGCPYIFHYDYYRELEIFTNCFEVDRSYVLYLATLNNARLIDMDKTIGSIEEGKLADLVVLNNNPLDTFKNIRNINMVIKDGAIIKNIKNKIDESSQIMLDKLFDLDMKKEVRNYLDSYKK